MVGIESISILRQTDRLDKASLSKEPLYVTKNGRTYLVVLSPALMVYLHGFCHGARDYPGIFEKLKCQE